MSKYEEKDPKIAYEKYMSETKNTLKDKNNQKSTKYCEVCNDPFLNIHYHWYGQRHQRKWGELNSSETTKKLIDRLERIEVFSTVEKAQDNFMKKSKNSKKSSNKE